MRMLFLISCLMVASLADSAHADTAAVQIAWRLLDYIAVDYPSAVQEGAVINQLEYEEMIEFSAAAQERIDALPPSDVKPTLQREVEALRASIANKEPAASIATQARTLAADLIEAYPVPLAPAKTPVLARGRALYELHCASCHGMTGKGDGPASFGLDPPVIAFEDKDRARERSIFALYQVIEQGLEGTSMVGYGHLPPQDLWDLALYSGTFAFPEQAVSEGEQIWKADSALRDNIDLVKLVGMTPASLAEEIGEAKADALTAYLRRHPEAVLDPTTGPLALARTRLEMAMAAYIEGDRKGAGNLALSAYLDGFEPIEPILTVRNNALMIRFEGAMAALRASISRGRPVDEVQRQVDTLYDLLTDVELALAPGEGTFGSTIIAAFTVLLREGVEALLIVIMMILFIRKAGRGDLLPYVHAGWVVALVAGGMTWVMATYFIEFSGASREMTEGFGSVLAALVLLWVGIWMHSKNSAEAWQRYIRDKLGRALHHRSAWFLFAFSFLVVYREAFETILFYVAIWNHGNGGSVLVGAAAGAVALFFIAWGMIVYSRSLPIDRFFAYSTLLIAALAVILIGKGVASLQEAGYLQIHPVSGVPRIAALGLFPTREGVLAQLGMIALLFIGLGYTQRRTKKDKTLN